MASMFISAHCFAQDSLVPFDAHSSIWGGMFAPQSPEGLDWALNAGGTLIREIRGFATDHLGSIRALGRTSQDPLATKYPGISPYSYCAGDPVNYFDPEGMDRVIKEKKHSKVISATFYVKPEKHNNIDVYDAFSSAARYLNKAKGLKYSDGKNSYSVSFDLSVRISNQPFQSALDEKGANYVEIDKSATPQKDKNGDSIIGSSNNGGKKVVIYHSAVGNIGVELHEMLHSLGAAIKTDDGQSDPHEPTGLMTKSTKNQTMIITQQTINSIIENGKEQSH